MSFKEVFKSFPLIELKRLRLRSMRPSDAERYLGWFSAKEVEYSCRIRPPILRHPGSDPVTSGQSSYRIRALFLRYPAS